MKPTDADKPLPTTDPTPGQAAEAPPAWLSRDVQPVQENGSPSLLGQPTSAFEPGQTAPPRDEISPAVSQPLPAFPGYEILGVLGRGGMGVVYKARDVKLKRTVALKVILAGAHAGARELARFNAEAETVARLQHPNIVQIYEVGAHDGKPFISLEFCTGGSLDAKLDGTPLPPKDAAQLMEKLARAMHAAHQAQVIHRDLKPANVLLQMADGRLQNADLQAPNSTGVKSAILNLQSAIPKITDFGLAKKLDDIGQTQSGAIMGTPSYMAPEQAGGKSKDLGPSADIYALGAILYELLTGRPPFKAATPLDTILQVVADDPVPPAQLQSRTPRDLETICLKCLRKEPAKRYASAAELADELERYLRGEPILARPVGKIERAVKWVKRNKGLSAGLGAAALALLLGTGVATWQAVEARVQAKIARENEDIAKQALKKADDKQEELSYNLALDKILLAQADFDSGNLALARQRLEQVPTDLRRWEWQYLKRQFHGGIFTLHDHTNFVVSVAFSPNGTRLATGSYDKTAKVWDARTGTLLLDLKGHIAPVSSVGFSPDGSRLITGSHDGTAKVWDARTGVALFDIKGHKSFRVESVAFSPDGTRLVTGSWDKTAKLWDAGKGSFLAELKGHADGVESVAFSPDGMRLVTAGLDDTPKVWDARTGTPLFSLKGHKWIVQSVAFSPDGTRLATGSYDKSAKIWDARNGTPLLELKGHSGIVESVAFSPDGTRLATGNQDGTLKVWDARTGVPLISLKGHTRLVKSVAFSPDGTRLVSGSYDKTAQVWDAANGTPMLELKGRVRSVSLSPDGTRLVTGGWDKTVRVWDARSGTVVLDLKQDAGTVESVAFSSDGTRLVTGSENGTVKVWDAYNGTALLTLQDHFGERPVRVWSVAFSPDGTRLVAGSENGTVKVWDARTGTRLLELERAAFDEKAIVTFSPDGMRLLTGSYDGAAQVGNARVWDACTGKQLLDLKAHPFDVTSVTFSPDGTRLFTGSSDGTAKVWDAQTGTTIVELDANPVLSAAFSPDGTRLVTGSAGRRTFFGDVGTVKLWDARTGIPLLELKGHFRAVFDVAFSRNGTRLVIASEDGVQIIDPVRSTDEREYRLFWTRPRLELHREEYAKAMEANDTFAAHFHLDRLLAYLPQERASLLAERSKLQKSDLLLQARTTVHSPKVANGFLAPIALLTMQRDPDALRLLGPIAFLAMHWDPQALRLLGGLSLRAGKPTSAIPPLKLALALRRKDRPPVEELLLALAYLDSKEPGEAAKWHGQATLWLDRYRQPMQVISVLAALPSASMAGITELVKTPADPRYNPFDWETWYECEVFRAEVEAKMKRK